MITHVEQVMGTVASITIDPGGCGDAEAASALAGACQTLHDADAMFSTFRPDSALMRNRRGDLSAEEMPAQLLEVLELSARAVRLTGGAFDPWAMPDGFDPTGLVKGWAAQLAADELRNAGMAAAMVNAGGDIACFGPAPWRIGVRHPTDAQLLVCVAEVRTAIATSGGYERPGDILDPRSGRPAQSLTQATVTGPNLPLADAYATALIVCGADGLAALAQTGYNAVIVTAEGCMLATPGFPIAVTHVHCSDGDVTIH
jgi:thiamine biosynthesis lipoprotein